METLFKVCALGAIGVFAISGLRRSIPEISVAATLATVIALVAVAGGTCYRCITLIYELAENSGISDSLVTPLLKCVGISAVTKIGGDICRDSGVGAVAAYIELVGGAMAVSISMPLIFTLLNRII